MFDVVIVKNYISMKMIMINFHPQMIEKNKTSFQMNITFFYPAKNIKIMFDDFFLFVSIQNHVHLYNGMNKQSPCGLSIFMLYFCCCLLIKSMLGWDYVLYYFFFEYNTPSYLIEMYVILSCCK